MTDETVSPLRRRMIEDMTIRGFTAKTQHDYIRHVRSFAAFFGRSPHKAGAEDLRRYHLHLASSGIAGPSMNSAVSALRFFFKVTLSRLDVTELMPFVREPQRLPEVLSPDEVVLEFLIVLEPALHLAVIFRKQAGSVGWLGCGSSGAPLRLRTVLRRRFCL